MSQGVPCTNVHTYPTLTYSNFSNLHDFSSPGYSEGKLLNKWIIFCFLLFYYSLFHIFLLPQLIIHYILIVAIVWFDCWSPIKYTFGVSFSIGSSETTRWQIYPWILDWTENDFVVYKCSTEWSSSEASITIAYFFRKCFDSGVLSVMKENSSSGSCKPIFSLTHLVSILPFLAT